MWLYLAALLGLYFLRRWYPERQTVENLTKKYVFITGCDSGFGNQLARQLDVRSLRVLAACLTQEGAEQLEKATPDRLKTTVLDITSTESVAAATEWVKEQVQDEVTKFFTLQIRIKNYYLITDTMQHALTSCHSRTCYSVGWDANYIFIPLSYLPASFGDYFTTFHLPRPAGAVSGL